MKRYADLHGLLLIEDNPADADLIRELLIDAGGAHVEVAHVETLADAVRTLPSLAVDVVLLDLRLPDGEGTECVETLIACSPDVPIVVLTGLDDEELAIKCLTAGAQDYLSKQDVVPGTLRRALGYAVTRAREESARRRADELQQRLAAIVDASMDAIVSMTPDGVITTWNRGAELTFGHSREEAVGRPAREILRPLDAAGAEQQQQRIAALASGAAAGAFEDIVRLRKDGTPIAISAVACNLRDGNGRIVGTAAICRDVTEARERDAQLLLTNQVLRERELEMRALTRRVDAIREAERTRISRDVHDGLGQLLTGLKMDLRWIERRLGSGPENAALTHKLTDAEAMVDETIAAVQRIALELRPSALDTLGLAPAIRDEARRFGDRTGVATRVRISGDGNPPEATATGLFRILQELLTNVARHASASELIIDLEEVDDAWFLRVEDDGVGLPDGAADGLTALGVLGMRERAESLGGIFELKRGPSRGTVATVRVPA